MGDGEGFVGFALFFHTVRPVVHGLVRPVVFPVFQFFPRLFRVGSGRQNLPQGRGVDEHPIVDVRGVAFLDDGAKAFGKFLHIVQDVSQPRLVD